MDDKDRETLRRNRINLRKNIANPDDINELLFERDIFTENMKQEVEAQRTVILKIQKILDIVPKRGSQAFEEFYQILIDTGNGEAADFLRPELKESRLQNQGQLNLDVHKQATTVDNELPPDWPNEKYMTEDIHVKPCSTSSRLFREKWNDSMTFSMKKRKRGRAVIINNKVFWGSPLLLPERTGTEKDRDRLTVLFKQLYFEVIPHNDLTADEIRNALASEVGNQDHATADCFILVILSHGTCTGIYGVDGNTISLEQITSYFGSKSCPNLAGKPKIFFIQACQGDDKDTGGVPNTGQDLTQLEELNVQLKAMDMNESESKRDSVLSSENRIQDKRDMLIASATHPGYVSLRNILFGSWFIQAVILVFQRFAHQDELSTLLKKVNNVVSKGRTTDSATKADIMQAARYTDSFIKSFYFFPGCHE